MSNAYLLVPILTLLLGGIGGYFLGRYNGILIDKITLLEKITEVAPEPSITMGEYTPPTEVSETDSPIGIAETKTPQRVEFEYEQETERQGRSL